MERSDSIMNLAKALSVAQGSMVAAKMDKVNPFLKSKYADLGSVIMAAKQPLKDNGLAVSQLVSGDGARVIITTILMHASGEWLSSDFTMPVGEARGKSQVQEIGSIITYLRRYSLASILGVHADEDVDGAESDEKKNGKVAKPPEPTPAQPEQSPKMTIEMAEGEFSTTYQMPYGQVATEALSNIYQGLSSAKKKLTDEQQRKKDAIDVIMAARSAGRPVQTEPEAEAESPDGTPEQLL
jgi:hypothetical protein